MVQKKKSIAAKSAKLSNAKDNSTPTINITSYLHEERVFHPSKDFSKRAHIKSMAEYRRMYP